MARRVHPIRSARWPTAEEAAQAALFQPGKIGSKVSRTRTWVPAMVPWRSNEDGFVTPSVLDWYGRFAEGRPGVLVVEATGIRDVPSGPLLRVGHDRFVEGLRELVRVVRERSAGSTLLLLQIIDFLRIRRRPERERFLKQFLVVSDRHRRRYEEEVGARVSDLPEEGFRDRLCALSDEELRSVLDEREYEDLTRGARERVTDVELPHIAELPRVLPELFAAAARRCREAGFDGVELHYAHAYTMASFLSRKNDRGDGYGGSREQRARLPLEVFERVRREVGSDFVVGCRFLGDEVIEGGGRIEDAVDYARWFARAGMDFLSVSKGGKFEDAKPPKVGEVIYPYTGESGHECMPTVYVPDDRGPFGRNLPLSRAIRAAIRQAGCEIPVVGAGGIHEFDQAECALREGDCDFVAAARQSLADPDWWRKMELGRGAEVRRCKYTNYCEALDQRHREVTCQLWDRELTVPDSGRETAQVRIALSEDGRRRLIAPPWKAEKAGQVPER